MKFRLAIFAGLLMLVPVSTQAAGDEALVQAYRQMIHAGISYISAAQICDAFEKGDLAKAKGEVHHAMGTLWDKDFDRALKQQMDAPGLQKELRDFRAEFAKNRSRVLDVCHGMLGQARIGFSDAVDALNSAGK